MEYKNETKGCQNCKAEFIIESEDFSFYEKMKVPPPTFCPECRFQRRLSFCNIFSLYKRNCAKCDESIISMFHKDKKIPVFCSKCWWADDWDGLEYGIEYDPKRNFFEQLYELKTKTPSMALDTLHSSLVNSTYTNYSSFLKNSYGLFFADYAQDSFYCDFLAHLKDSSDCSRVRESELCFGSVGLFKCFGCVQSQDCDNSVNLFFSKNCSSCTDCFGCVNLKKKSYCIFNKQYTKEEYFEFIKNAKLSSFSSFMQYKKQAEDFWLTQPMRAYYGNSLNVNVSGEYVFESKNAHNVYMVTSVEDSKHVQMISVASTKDSYDYTCWGGNSERIYESLIVGHGASDIKFCLGSYPDALLNEYSYYASGCKNVFGCVNLKKQQYCILNKQYSKEDFHKLKEQIISDMKNNPYIDKQGRIWKYGEFFPALLSSFGYNETFANQHYPKTKEEAIASGFDWVEYEPNTYGHTIEASELPERLEDSENILNEIIKCDCGRCFQIVAGELNILKKLNIPIPRFCFECRRADRYKSILKPKMYERDCMKCGKQIKTSYAPDRPEIVYCEKCYQDEVY